jgi:hypothetical protein
MIQEEKQLLLQDLCARLPYGVVVELDEKFGFNKGPHTLVKELLDLYCVEGIKPYLRPMSSMTEEEWNDYKSTWKLIEHDLEDTYEPCIESFDWLNAHHFDYRGLIEKGLAIKVTRR